MMDIDDQVGTWLPDVEPWMRWRFGERVCVRCGASPDRTVLFPPWSMVSCGLADDGPQWELPVCSRHGMVSVWPVRLTLAIADEHKMVMGRLPERVHELTLWGVVEVVRIA